MRYIEIYQNVQTPRPRNRCCPYDFDSSLCRVVDDRVLCGYNLNVGKPISKNNPIELNGGCRIRGGRLECGYQQPPFTNLRRPPAWNDKLNDSQDKDVNEPMEDKGDESEEVREKLKYLVKLTTKKHRSAVTRCVEIRERIVCTHM
ncbi:uncharacterized protein LOC115446280 isoform X2 [Manduca sexta]|uniref:uncharacterized protein LOC115446280 isoform X2 n=1 Tax=Manduca sexta TaxID=7130 RepID=UPI001184355F|nr:uncharacterized protein LOC115446280 isoform X2 [Manduca sexta]